MMINPTGQGIRNDAVGLGTFMAARGKRRHLGIDLICNPDQMILSPIAGVIERKAFPYADDMQWQGFIISNRTFTVRFYYAKLNKALRPGSTVLMSEWIATAQDISQRYEGCTPHIHMEVKMKPGALLDNKMQPTTKSYFINPELLIGSGREMPKTQF
jgi:hypothetical protein